MGNIWLSRPGLAGGTFPEYLDKWGMPYRLRPNWAKIGRQNDTGLDAVLGIIDHHDAIGAHVTDTWASSIPPRWGGRRVDGPVGHGSLDHDGVLDLWAAGATNTAGQGGPLLGSRGVIAKDNANRTTLNFEARNDGVGEAWRPAQIEHYPLLMAASLDWATHETPGVPLGAGDVWAHCLTGPGWTNRKIDPVGPSPWATGARTWDMHAFRGSVFAVQLAGPPTATPDPIPIPDPPEEDDDMAKHYLVRDSRDGAYYVTDMATFKTPVNNGDQAGDDVRLFGVVGHGGGEQPIPIGAHYSERIDRLPTVGS